MASVSHEGVGEADVELQAGPCGGQVDRTPNLLRGRLAQQDRGVAEHPGQGRVLGELPHQSARMATTSVTPVASVGSDARVSR